MLKCVICNKAGWNFLEPNCKLCLLKRKVPLPKVSEHLFNELIKIDTKLLEDINTDAHARYKAFMEYGIIREWDSERIFLDYVEAAEVTERSTGLIPINIPLTINESDYYKLDFSHYKSPKEEYNQNQGQFGRGRPAASSLPQSAALGRKAA